MSLINISLELIENIGSYGLNQIFIRKSRPENVSYTPGHGKKKKFLYSSFIKSWTPNTVKMAASTVPLLTRHTVPAP